MTTVLRLLLTLCDQPLLSGPTIFFDHSHGFLVDSPPRLFHISSPFILLAQLHVGVTSLLEYLFPRSTGFVQ
jgi:hypothetical protein